MDFQDIISLLIFAAFIAFRYFMKGREDKNTKPKNRRKPSTNNPYDTSREEVEEAPKKTSPFEDLLKEFEKELDPTYTEEKEPELEPEPLAEAYSPSEDPEYLRKKAEMQKAAEASYENATKTPSYLEEDDFFSSKKSKKTTRKKRTFHPRTAYMYKELLDRKHFKV